MMRLLRNNWGMLTTLFAFIGFAGSMVYAQGSRDRESAEIKKTQIEVQKTQGEIKRDLTDVRKQQDKIVSQVANNAKNQERLVSIIDKLSAKLEEVSRKQAAGSAVQDRMEDQIKEVRGDVKEILRAVK